MMKISNHPYKLWQVAKNRTWSISHTQLFVSSFVFLIILGALLFKFLPNLYVGEEMSWIDALFTSTSAICVTGLIVVDTATYFTFWGQLLILVLIQLGGLGMLTFTSLIILALGKKLSLKQETIYRGFAGNATKVKPHKLIFKIVIFSFLIELIGALVLCFFWIDELGLANSIWHAVFHSVSAFCNAGFSTFSNSLESSATNPGIILCCSALIVLGGLGFLTLTEVASWIKGLRNKSDNLYRLSLQSKIVLTTSVTLILTGFFLFITLEWRGVFSGLSLFDKLNNALFMSITSRTAGFNSINYSEASDATNFLNIIFMMIGGSPGSTAGGIKTTTFFLVILLAWSRLKGEVEPTFSSRSIPSEIINRAFGLLVVASGVVTLFVFIFCITENQIAQLQKPFLVIFFEVVSAFNTVGLSIGNTSEFSPTGKIFLICLMFLGRVGPLTFAAAIFFRSKKSKKYRYAYEEVVVG